MIEPALYAAFGACLATLILLLFLPALWRRAVRLTTRRLAGKLPLSVSEIIAAQDRLRAEHAMATRAVERRTELLVADAARERVAAGRSRAQELGLKAEIANLQESIRVLETTGAVARNDLDRTGVEFAETSRALETAKAEAQAAVRERDAAKKAASVAELAADSLRIDLATTEAALASTRAELADSEKRLKQAGESISAKEEEERRVGELLRAETSRVADANAAKLAAERQLVDETANVVALKAEMARAAPATGATDQPAAGDALVALRTKLDEVADEIVRAAAAPDASSPKRAPTPAGERARRTKLQPSHAGV